MKNDTNSYKGWFNNGGYTLKRVVAFFGYLINSYKDWDKDWHDSDYFLKRAIAFLVGLLLELLLLIIYFYIAIIFAFVFVLGALDIIVLVLIFIFGG